MRSCTFWGACGVGKSQIVSQVANDLEYDFLDVRAVQLDPVDLRGLPRIAVYLTEWVPMKFLPTAGKGVLFLDELVVDLPTPPWSAWNLSYSCNKSPLCGFSLISEGKVRDQLGRPLRSQASRTRLLAGTAEHVKQTDGSSDSTPFKYRTQPETMWTAQLSH